MKVYAAEDQATTAGKHEPEYRKDHFTFESCPLTAPGDIRVLGLMPGEFKNPIECSLATQSLVAATQHDRSPKYTALSYAWGQEEPTHSIKMYTAGNYAGRLCITPDLHAAMRQLRDSECVVFLWIDAICINQANIQEKNRQVPLMAEVYRRAEHVCVWLGESSDDRKVALDFIRRPGVFLATSASALRERNWRLFYAFISIPWFRHRWSIQAIALARKATLICGDYSFDWHELANALSIVQIVLTEFSNDNTRYHEYDDWGHMSLQPAFRLAEIRNDLHRVSDNGDGTGSRWSLEALTWKFQDFETSDPRDAIYALLALAEDRRQELPAFYSFTHMPVNYNWIYPDVCKNYIASAIQTSGSLDVLFRPWEHYKEGIELFPGGVPSWLPQKQSFTFGRSELGKYARINADVLVGPPEPGKRYYNACDSVAVTKACTFGTGTKNNSILVEGLIVDVITGKKTFARPGGEYSLISDGVPDEWRAAGGWLPSAKEPPDAYWRTLVADRGPNGRAAPDFYPAACREQATRYVHIANHYKGKVGTPLTKAHDALVNKFVQRVQEVVLNRRLVETECRRLGLAPYRVKRGDFVCILFGCSVPILLRQQNDADTHEEYFQIIGDCYIHGIMDGQLIEMARRESGNYTIPKQLFEIR